ncbi:MAG TPA: hypothetical protein VHO06_27050 [Polyangia bacterium]|nr:hypothetical protein [Polyangia bacterium]
MSSAAVPLPPPAPKRVERRWSRLPWGIEIQTWRLVQTRTLPAESESLPLAAIFADDEEAELGAIPTDANEQADTLESSPEGDITQESPAPAYRADETEKP